MTPAELNLTAYRGTTFAQTFICKNGSSVVVNISGWTAHALVRSTPQRHIVLDLEPTIPVGTDGAVVIAFTDEDTLAWTPGDFIWDLILERPSGERLGPFLAGTFTISTAVSRA